MIPDPTDDIRAIRDRLAAQYDFDLDRIVEETRRRQRESGRPSVSLPAREPSRNDTPNPVRAAIADRPPHTI